MKNTSRERIVLIWVLSLIFFASESLIKSRVSVELEARTRAASVDMEADRTRITTSPARASGKDETIVGIILSNMTAPASL
jgi:hypothetical protein